jgi:hypothetical protein
MNKAVARLRLLDKDLYINKRAPTEHNMIRNSKEMKEFCIEWKRRPCVFYVARSAKDVLNLILIILGEKRD